MKRRDIVFNIRLSDGKVSPVRGYPVTADRPGTYGVHEVRMHQWRVTELRSGLAIVEGKTRVEAVAAFHALMNRIPPRSVQRQINKRLMEIASLICLCIALTGCALPAACEELPDAPLPGAGVTVVRSVDVKPTKVPFLASRSHRGLVAAEFTFRLLDAVTTEQFLHDSCHCLHERVLPGPIVNHAPAMYAYSLGAAVGVTLLSDELWKHNHHKLAKLPLLLDSASEGIADINNRIIIANARGKKP